MEAEFEPLLQKNIFNEKKSQLNVTENKTSRRTDRMLCLDVKNGI